MVEVRAAAGTDAAAIAALMTQLGYPCSDDDATARLGYWLADPMSRVLVAENDGLVIGCLSVHAVPYLERTGRWARIESLIIDEAARGTGAGRALLHTAESLARRRGRCAGGQGWQPWASGAAGSVAPSKTTALPLARACPRESVRVELSQLGPRGGRDGIEYLVEAGRPPTARHAVARENRL